MDTESLYRGRFAVRYSELLKASVKDKRMLQLHINADNPNSRVAVHCTEAVLLVHVDDFYPRITATFAKADNRATTEELAHSLKTKGIYAPYVPLINTPLVPGLGTRIK